MTDHRPQSAAPISLGARLERLFSVQRPASEPQRPWRNSEVVAACRASGRELSESHLSELRRGIKTNPTMRVLETLAWFFEVRVGYFTDPAVAAEVEGELAYRETELQARLEAEREAEEDVAAAARELRQALRQTGASRTSHRAVDAAQARQRASMMRALARALNDDDANRESDRSEG